MGKVVYNPYGGFFLAKIQELPFVLKFWVVLRNIVEVVPRMLAGEDVTINYFAQLFVIKSESGKNLYTGLQEVTKKLWGCKFQAEAMDLEQKGARKAPLEEIRASLEEVVLAHEYEFSFDDFGENHVAWVSDLLPKMKLKCVKMSAEKKAQIVNQWVESGKSPLLDAWLEKVNQIADLNHVILEGSDNCAGPHPGVIFTADTIANDKLPWKDHLQKYTQEQVEIAHANIASTIIKALPEKPLWVQGGFGITENAVDGAFATLMKEIGQGNLAAPFGSCAWLTWAKGTTRSTEMGLAEGWGSTEK